MNTCVTGSVGFIGTALCARLVNDGHVIFRHTLTNNTEVLFHLAARVRNDASIDDPVTTMDSNVMTSGKLFSACKMEKVPVVYTSSAVVYSPIRTPYQISKIAADSLAQFYNEHGGDIRILRLAEVYGPGMRNGPIAAWREQYRAKGEIDVWTGSQKKDYIYISDAVEALVQAVKLPAGVYDVCSGVQTDLHEFAKMLGLPMRSVPPKRPVALELPQTPHPAFTMKVSLAEGMAEVRKEFA